MLLLGAFFSVVLVSTLYAVSFACKMYKNYVCSNIKYSETEADSKCTFEDYKFFELARK